MNTQQLLDELLGAGRQIADKGKDYLDQGADYAADKLGVDADDPAARDTFRKGAMGGAAAAGAMALILGTGAGRALGGAALRLGGIAALGTLAYNAYRNYTAQTGQQPEADDLLIVGRLEGPDANKRAETLLAAMLTAARSDGHIDDVEREIIATRLKGMSANLAFVQSEMAAPIDPQRIAAMADSAAAGREIYAVSVIATDPTRPSERKYLNDLAAALSIDPALARAIEEDALKSRETA